jgi:hypothetical protein
MHSYFSTIRAGCPTHLTFLELTIPIILPKIENYEAPHYASFSNLQSFQPSLAQMFFSAACSQTSSVHVTVLYQKPSGAQWIHWIRNVKVVIYVALVQSSCSALHGGVHNFIFICVRSLACMERKHGQSVIAYPEDSRVWKRVPSTHRLGFMLEHDTQKFYHGTRTRNVMHGVIWEMYLQK